MTTGESARPPRRLNMDEYELSTPSNQLPKLIFGQRVGYLPETYEQLLELISATSDPDCVAQDDIDLLIEMIGQSESPDALVQLMPYEREEDGGLFIYFVLPVANNSLTEQPKLP